MLLLFLKGSVRVSRVAAVSLRVISTLSAIRMHLSTQSIE